MAQEKIKISPELEKKLSQYRQRAEMELKRMDAFIQDCRQRSVSPKIICNSSFGKPLND